MNRLIAVAVLSLASFAPDASADIYTIDKSHSETTFRIRHLVTRVRGSFRDFDAKIIVDSSAPAKSSVEFVIDAASISTDLADRDAHLRGADFFDVGKYPQIRFLSTRIAPSGKNRFSVTGSLTIRDVSKTITLPVTFLGFVKDPWGNEKAGLETAIKLNRKDFGIVWNAALDNGGVILGDEVEIEINLEAVRQRSAERVKQGGEN